MQRTESNFIYSTHFIVTRRQTDGSTLLEERVGGILKNGLTLGGRPFEFLAYSSSALREHVVWFVQPFMHPQFGTDVLKPMNLDNIIDQEVKTLSGGELQRVAIVLALGAYQLRS